MYDYVVVVIICAVSASCVILCAYGIHGNNLSDKAFPICPFYSVSVFCVLVKSRRCSEHFSVCQVT